MSTIHSNPSNKPWFITCCGWRTKLLIIGMIIILTIQMTLYRNGERQSNGILKTQNTRRLEDKIEAFTVVGDYSYFIYSVHGEMSLENEQWSSIVFNGWEIKKRAIPYICCLKFKYGVIFTSTFSETRNPFREKKGNAIHPLQIVCDIKIETPPEFATLVVEETQCYNSSIHFHRPEYRQVIKEPRFAIDAKLAHGNKDAGELIEFMEYHLHYGAGPIIIYQHQSLNKNARKVLKYYARNGDLEVINYPEFLLGRYRRDDSETRIKTSDLSTNQQVADLDAQQRLRYFTYLTVMDTDEYIVPGKNITNFLQLMECLVESHNNAAAFQLLSEIHLKNWKPSNRTSPLMIGRYGYHTEPTYMANKIIHLPNRVVPGTVWPHGATPKEGYESIELKKEEAVLKHFRLCKEDWRRINRTKPCMALFQKMRGHYMDNIADNLSEKVLNVKQRLGIL